ncbi:MAG: LysE family transporter [Desulfobacterales bacterium]|nr:LysE family transporter [Desulfobacterales bacterium]
MKWERFRGGAMFYEPHLNRNSERIPLYLGCKAFKSWRKYDAGPELGKASGKKTLLRAVLVNLLNPAPYLAWSLIMGPLFLEGWAIAPVNGIALLAGFYLTIVAALTGTIILFALARQFGPDVRKCLLGCSSMVLLAFGIHQLWAGIVYF